MTESNEGRTTESTNDIRPHSSTWRENCGAMVNLLQKFNGLIIALATVFLFLATLALYCATRDLVVGAEKTAERQLRAYVYASPYRAFHIDNLGGVVQIYTIIGSKGSTFAHQVERSVGVNLLPGPVPEKFEDLGSLKREEGALVLAPGAQSFVIQNFRVITADELAKIMTPNGDLRIYAFGKITYKDAFGKPRQTTFCYAYFGPERLPFGSGFAFEHWQAKSCDRHNNAS